MLQDRPQAVLSVNAGSSSLKFAVYPVRQGRVAEAGLAGLAEGLEPGGLAKITVKPPGRDKTTQALVPQEGESSFEAALRAVIAAVEADGGTRLVAVAHRVVHGGSRFAASVLIDDEIQAYLESLDALAPLHQPHNLAGVRAFRRACPGVPQVACFDTAFHAHTPEVEQRFALPEEFFQQGVRRYGFHGLSYQYVNGVLGQCSARGEGRLLLAHLGNGASLCAVRGGRSIATTMGFSALDGLMMGTRSGAIDAGVLLHLLRQGQDGAAIEKLLYKQSGLLGVSGLSADMRSLRASPDAAAARAIALFTYRVVRECGALAACLGGVDLIAFTGGIGEHDAQLRAEVCQALAFLGVRLDPAANKAATGSAVAAIHAASSTVELWVVPTDEGRVAARDAMALIEG
ncbi:acetate/propionate family kinase [Rubrivivax sp. A210]|uniref:acetate/propionate family kinase n=1 Tax=Rubrivivax sp. A210 TaxID=2772301 RepID=UPI00191A845B|nr:acetate/propionate family kinase [Rubrivivax sp. A210]